MKLKEYLGLGLLAAIVATAGCSKAADKAAAEGDLSANERNAAGGGGGDMAMYDLNNGSLYELVDNGNGNLLYQWKDGINILKLPTEEAKYSIKHETFNDGNTLCTKVKIELVSVNTAGVECPETLIEAGKDGFTQAERIVAIAVSKDQHDRQVTVHADKCEDYTESHMLRLTLDGLANDNKTVWQKTIEQPLDIAGRILDARYRLKKENKTTGGGGSNDSGYQGDGGYGYGDESNAKGDKFPDDQYNSDQGKKAYSEE